MVNLRLPPAVGHRVHGVFRIVDLSKGIAGHATDVCIRSGRHIGGNRGINHHFVVQSVGQILHALMESLVAGFHRSVMPRVRFHGGVSDEVELDKFEAACLELIDHQIDS